MSLISRVEKVKLNNNRLNNIIGYKQPMKVTISITGIFSAGPIRLHEVIDVDTGTDLAGLFKILDKKGIPNRRFFKSLLRDKKPPAILRNGLPVKLPQGLEDKLNDKDTISVVSSIAGG